MTISIVTRFEVDLADRRDRTDNEKRRQTRRQTQKNSDRQRDRRRVTQTDKGTDAKRQRDRRGQSTIYTMEPPRW